MRNKQLYFIKNPYNTNLVQSQISFLEKENRAYLSLGGLNYKGSKIGVVVPLRANIPIPTVKAGLFVKTDDTNHTIKGRQAGWDIANIIPFDNNHFSHTSIYGIDKQNAVKVAYENIKSIRAKAQEVLNNHEQGQSPEAGLKDFDKALSICKELALQKDTTEIKETKSDQSKVEAKDNKSDNIPQKQSVISKTVGKIKSGIDKINIFHRKTEENDDSKKQLKFKIDPKKRDESNTQSDTLLEKVENKSTTTVTRAFEKLKVEKVSLQDITNEKDPLKKEKLMEQLKSQNKGVTQGIKDRIKENGGVGTRDKSNIQDKDNINKR